MTRNAQFTEEQWEEMRPWLMQNYVREGKPANVVAAGVPEQFGWPMSVRQLKHRMFDKWNIKKKVDADVYFAMKCVMDAKGNHLVFNIPLPHEEQIHNASTVRKELNRKFIERRKKAVKRGESYQDPLAEWRDIRKSMARLRHSRAVITGLGSDPYADIPSDMGDFNDQNDDEDDSGDDAPSDADESELPPQSPPYNEPVTTPSPPYKSGLSRPGAGTEAQARWLARIFGLISFQQNNPFASQDLDLKGCLDGRNLKSPQIDGLDTMSEMLLRTAISLNYHDVSRSRFERLMDCNLGDMSKQWTWERTDTLAVEFASYYIQQCLSLYPDLDTFDHPDRAASRARLSELLHARTGELLQVLWWVMTFISTHYKVQQLEGLFQDVIACIESSGDDYTRALRPIFEVARRANAEYIGAICDEQEYQRSSPDPNLEFELRQNIQYLRSIGMDNTGDFMIMHMFLAWHLCATEKYVESIDVITSPDCLPLGERRLGSYHIAVLNCKAIAARCYHQQQNGLAMQYMDEALFALRECTKPLQAFRNVLKRQQAALYIAQGQRSNGFKALAEVVDFRLETFGPKSHAVWSVIREIQSMARDDNEKKFAQRYEQKVRERLAAGANRRRR